jgi:hypothetical protein
LGNITTTALSPQANGSMKLTPISFNTGCSPSPPWLEIDKKIATLYRTDKGLADPTKATFSPFQTSSSGTLYLLNKITTLNGGVYSNTYGNGAVLAIAH